MLVARAYEKEGEAALVNSKPCPQNPKHRTPPHIEEKILHLRRTYHLGQRPIHWYLLRYHGINVSSGAVYYLLKRHGLNRLPRSTMRTDNGHEFQSLFHWQVEELGMKHTYIRVRTSRLDGQVERSHRTDKEEFYQLLTYTGDDVDLNVKLKEWENFYNYHRPHSALAGKTPYEVLREKLNLNAAEVKVE